MKKKMMKKKMKNRTKIIHRFPHDGESRWLILFKKHEKIVLEGKTYPDHGDIINREMAGNGYHGRCERCGMPLVTDLGYTSWKGTVCVVKPVDKIETTITYGWTKFKKRAYRLTPEKAAEHHSNLIHEQGWGDFNYQIQDV